MEALCAKIWGREMLVRAPTDRESRGAQKTAKFCLAVFLCLLPDKKGRTRRPWALLDLRDSGSDNHVRLLIAFYHQHAGNNEHDTKVTFHHAVLADNRSTVSPPMIVRRMQAREMPVNGCG